MGEKQLAYNNNNNISTLHIKEKNGTISHYNAFNEIGLI